MIADVRGILYTLREMGFDFGCITYDSFQSRESIQELSRYGFTADLLSVDRTIEPYDKLKEALYESRLVIYDHPILIRELMELEKNTKQGKVDHRPNGRKDVADALCGMYYGALHGYYQDRGIIVTNEAVPGPSSEGSVDARDLALIDPGRVEEDFDDLEYFK